ncbi:hypothetical protein QT17_08330 [Thermus sp. 2.9]|uniref:hypothetical protein n=1 Tax=Thermus sp. (strain 2.9) TaxID=1577051 RepID=UPI000542DCFE|nr:hypothetical protein [Thermus sp. 2.9]KHG65151.1 hypothetical protein QT17_08330 [Thermus sp. 2.9]
MTGKGRGVLVFLYVLLALTASTGVALQLYLMQVQNPGLRLDLCQSPGEKVEVEHSPLCGLQVAPGGPVVEAPASPQPLALGRVRPVAAPGHPAPLPQVQSPRAPPFPQV